MKLEIIIFLMLINTIVFGQEINKGKIEKLKNEAIRIENEIKIRTDSLSVLKG